MSGTSPERPLARLSIELRISGVGQFALGLGCLAAALSASDLPFVRAVVPFLVAGAAAGGLSLYASRWMRGAETPPVGPGARVEAESATTRRCLIALALILVAVGVAAVLGPGIAVVLGGIVGAAGLVDLINRNQVRARERALGAVILRETGWSPFASGRRPLYTLPTSERTLAT